MKTIKLLILLILFSPFAVLAGKVRTLPTNSQEMPIIHLMTGRSTVLRFSSPPKKVIIGNQNYFSIEFIDSDVTLQPLSNTTSNLFVYGDGFTYGFILKVDHLSDYDDLIFVKNKVPPFSISASEKAPSKTNFSRKDLQFSILPNKNSKLNLEGGVFKWNESIKSYYSDFFIYLKSTTSIPTESVKIYVLLGNQDITTIKAVFEKDPLLPKTKQRIRIFANVSAGQSLKIKLQINKEEEVFKLAWKK